MWLLKGSADGGPEKTIWLRPDRVYKAGRNETCEIVWKTPKSVSRTHLQLETGSVQGTGLKLDEQIVDGVDITKPVYPLALTALAKSIQVTRKNKSRIEAATKQPFDVQDGDVLEFAFKNESRSARLEWRPILVNLHLKTKSYDKLSKELNALGVRTLSKFSTISTTHMVTDRPYSGSLSMPLAALHQANIVKEEWALLLVKATATLDFPHDQLPNKPPDRYTDVEKEQIAILRNAQSAGSDDRYWGLSPLEQDFEAQWPDETKYFVPYGNKELRDIFPDDARWSPDPARAKIFENILLIGFGLPLQNHLMELARAGSGQGIVIPSEDINQPPAQLVRLVKDAIRPFDYHGTFQTFLVFMDEAAFGTQASASQATAAIARSVARDVPTTGSMDVIELTRCVYEARVDLAKFGQQQNVAGPAPSASAVQTRPTQTQASVAIPSTDPTHSSLHPRGPVEQPVAGPPRLQGAAESQPLLTPAADGDQAMASPKPTADEAMAPPPKKKLVRRAGKPRTDVLDDIFSGIASSMPPASQIDEASQEIGDSAEAEGVAQTNPTPAKSKNSRLKRRAGTQQNDDYLFEPERETQAKKRRVESDATEAAREQQAEPTPRINKRKQESEVVVEARKRAKKFEQNVKGKQELLRLQEEERKAIERIKDVNPTEANRRLRQADRAVREIEAGADPSDGFKTTAKLDELSAIEKEKREKYLQINHGRRKVNADEAQFTREFNALKIARPNLKAPHKPSAEKEIWQDKKGQREDDDDNLDDWTADVGKSFFIIKKLPVSAYKKPQSDAHADLTDIGGSNTLPNFKRFRPKGVPRGDGPQRAVVKLVCFEPSAEEVEATQKRLPYLAESDDSDESDTPKFEFKKKKTSKQASTKAKAKPKASTSKKKAQPMEMEDDEEDELDSQAMQQDEDSGLESGSTVKSDAKRKGAKKTQSKGRTTKKAPAVVEADSDDEITFKGFTQKRK